MRPITKLRDFAAHLPTKKRLNPSPRRLTVSYHEVEAQAVLTEPQGVKKQIPIGSHHTSYRPGLVRLPGVVRHHLAGSICHAPHRKRVGKDHGGTSCFELQVD